MNETLGQYLRRKREARLISIREISHSTGISIPMISALEEDKFHLVPRQEMITQYLKKYAACVSLDKKDVLNRYMAQYGRNHHKEDIFPQLSTFSDSEKLSKSTRRAGRLSRKQIIEGIFWAGIVMWALVLLYLYVHVMSLKKTGMLEIQEVMPPKEARQEAFLHRNDPMPSLFSERSGSSPARSPQETSRNVVSVSSERHGGMKDLYSQASSAQHAPGRVTVIGNRKSKLYHMPGMKYYHAVKTYNRIVFNSEAEAAEAGYRKAPE